MLSDSGRNLFCFPRALRITGSSGFEKVLTAGRRHKTPHFQVFALSGGGDAVLPRLGLVVSRRTGGAVERNLIKRRLREFFRLSQHRVRRGTEIVIRAFPGADVIGYATLTAEISEAFERLCVWM